MPASRESAVLLALVGLGCGPAPPDTGYVETDCLTLGGGFEGADLGALEAECRASGDTACTSESWIQADAARCVAHGGWWSVELRTTTWANLGVVYPKPHTQWAVGLHDESCWIAVAAATGEPVDSYCQ